jgi:hypothetical protein
VPTVYEYVPFASVNTIEVVLEDRVVPFRVTDHEVPDERPDSVKVTAKVAADTAANAMASETAAPLTTALPEAGFGVYPDTVPSVNE